MVLDATLHDRQLTRLRNLIGESRASRAVDAALGIQGHAWAQLDPLWFVNLFELETRTLRPVLVRLILERALAGLIANRAVKRMVDEEEFECGLLSSSNLFAVAMSVYDHVVRHIERAAGLELREVANNRISILVSHGLACFAITGR